MTVTAVIDLKSAKALFEKRKSNSLRLTKYYLVFVDEQPNIVLENVPSSAEASLKNFGFSRSSGSWMIPGGERTISRLRADPSLAGIVFAIGEGHWKGYSNFASVLDPRR